MGEYSSLLIGTIVGVIAFASTVTYMKVKAKPKNIQRELHFPNH